MPRRCRKRRFAYGLLFQRFGGLAVFKRALTDAEMKALHEAAAIETLK